MVKTVEMTTRKSEYYVSLADKAPRRFEKTDSNFEKSSTVGKNAIKQHTALFREIVHENKESISVANFTSVLF